jgi:peptide-methionine (S)-S-oxide reductase
LEETMRLTPARIGNRGKGAALAAALLLGQAVPALAKADARALPAPLLDAPVAERAAETAVLAGGCFWGVQGVFQHVKGVRSATAGYAGGAAGSARYGEVATGTTDHAEAVRISYDPGQISYGRILQIFFAVAHDPTELNRQGPDVGRQYRSAIFPTNPEQARIAEAYIAQLNGARVFERTIVTKIEPGQKFYAAEDYHQNFLTVHPDHPYIIMHDLPKIRDLQHGFPDLFRPDAVLVPRGAASN